MATLIETSEREVIEAARTIALDVAMGIYEQFAASRDGRALLEAVALLEERERGEQAMGTDNAPVDESRWVSLDELTEAVNKGGVVPTVAPESPAGSRYVRTVEHTPGRAPIGLLHCVDHRDSHTDCAVAAYERDQKAIADSSTINDEGKTGNAPPPRPGASPITRPPKKLSRRDQEIEKRRASDPMGRDRPEIDYSSIEDPEAR